MPPASEALKGVDPTNLEGDCRLMRPGPDTGFVKELDSGVCDPGPPQVTFVL